MDGQSYLLLIRDEGGPPELQVMLLPWPWATGWAWAKLCVCRRARRLPENGCG